MYLRKIRLGVAGAALVGVPLFASGCSSSPSATAGQGGTVSNRLGAAGSDTTTTSAGGATATATPQFPIPCYAVITAAEVSQLTGQSVTVGSPNQANASGNLCNFDSFHNDENDLYVIIDTGPNPTSGVPTTGLSGLGSHVQVWTSEYGARVEAYFGTWSLDVDQEGNNTAQAYTNEQVEAIACQAYKNVTGPRPTAPAGGTGATGTTGSSGNTGASQNSGSTGSSGNS